jgi:hypothetical protein
MTQTTQPLTLATLNQLLALAPQLTYADIAAAERAVLALPVPDAIALYRAFGRRRCASRADAARLIGRRLVERRGRAERGEVIGEIARLARG